MDFEFRIIEFLQRFQNGVLDWIMYILTFMGDEIFFVLVAAFIYWCVCKKFGFKFITVYIFGAGLLNVFKSIVKRPRPFQKHENIKPIIEASDGYSFPSGHCNSISSISTQLSQKAYTEKRGLRQTVIISAALTAIVMLTRMYLGQHYLTDVICGVIVGVAAALVLGYIYDMFAKYDTRFYIVILPLCVALFVALLIVSPDASSTVVKALGGYSAITLGFGLESKLVDYKLDKTVSKQLLRLAVGFAGAAIIMFGGGFLFDLLSFGLVRLEMLFSFFKYFLAGLWISFGAMYSFKKLKI